MQTITTESNEQAIHTLEQALIKIVHCASQLSDKQVWSRPSANMNSVGNLLLHLEGNLRQWVICTIGGKPDSRDRAAEFVASEVVPAAPVLQALTETVAEAKKVIGQLGASQLLERRVVQGFEVSVLGAVWHSVSHFVGHTHQIILLTRLQLGEHYQFHWTADSDRDKIPI